MTIANHITRPKQQQGMSLVELMISVAIGLLITLAISTLFLNTNRSNKENNDVAMMQENARFAMESIAEDLRHGGFFGNVQNPSEIVPNAVTMPAGTDCGSTAAGAATMLNFNSGQMLVNYSAGLTADQIATQLAPCTAAGTMASADNSLLVIKRVTTNKMLFGDPSTVLQGGRIYVHSNGSGALLGAGTATPLADTKTQIWEYSPRIYYITNTETLYRSIFSADWVDEPLAEGIEQFRVEFGIDSDTQKDGIPNYFVDASTDTNFDNVVSARVHVLARTLKADANYTDNNTYTLGALEITIPDNMKHYHRQVYSTTVTIPNMRLRLFN